MTPAEGPWTIIFGVHSPTGGDQKERKSRQPTRTDRPGVDQKVRRGGYKWVGVSNLMEPNVLLAQYHAPT
jgi:hypothetical protein